MTQPKGSRARKQKTPAGAPGLFVEPAAAPFVTVWEPGASARDVAAQLPRGGRMLVVSRGQFSLLDMIHAILERTGPASVMFTSWSTGMNDAEQMAWLLREGHIRTLRFFSGNGFQDRHPEYVVKLRALFGDDCVVTAELHCKIAVIVNDGWAVCVRSSCNLNRNPRIEQFDVDDSRPMAEFLIQWSEQLAAHGVAGWDPADREVARTAMRAWGGEWEERPANRPIDDRAYVAPPPAETQEAPVAFWRARWLGVREDIAKARADNPTLLPKLLPLETEAWRQLQMLQEG